MGHRRLLAGVLVLLVPVGATWAPFVHVHPDDHHAGHHAGTRVHAHLSDHPTSTGHGTDTGLSEDEAERTLTLQLFVAVSPGQASAEGLPEATAALAPAVGPAPRSERRVAHGHDPPPSTVRSPRAPPTPRLS